jgi:hypothetical protein
VIPAHLWPHILKLGPAGLGGVFTYLAYAPLTCVPKISGGLFGVPVSLSESCTNVIGTVTTWTQGSAILVGLAVFGGIALLMYLVTGRAIPKES